MNTRISLVAALLCSASVAPMLAGAAPWEVRHEVREGARNVEIERREAAREIQRCETRDCVARETREGRREVGRERVEARNEIRRERTGNYVPPARYYPNARYDGTGRYYGSNNDGRRDAHYHPGGQYCRDGRHIVHLRDGYYRGDRRWYRDGRYWDENDYVGRYYRSGNGNGNGNGYRHRDDDGNDDLLRGIAIGAAVVGVAAVIHDANDSD